MSSDDVAAAEILQRIVGAYDIRGLVADQLTPEIARALGAAFADEIAGVDDSGVSVDIVVGHDMRPSSPELAEAFADGACRRGHDVVMIGLVSTDADYFASGALQLPAAMFTASHNPAEYNGIKLSRIGARGISRDTGLALVRDRAIEYVTEGIPEAEHRGEPRTADVIPEYAAYLRSLVDLSSVRPLRIVVDAANGMAGLTVPAVLGTAAGLEALPIEILPLYFELDGTFPNHEANPLEPKNLVDLQAEVITRGADLGLAFDGDADRCFVVDEKGQPVTPSAIAGIVAEREIARARAADPDAEIHVVHNLITSRWVPETIAGAGATPVRTRVGHSLIKDTMAQTGAVFGGEHSAHYYFRDFWGADNGLLAAMHILAAFGAQDAPMSQFAAPAMPYAVSGEINSTVTDVSAAIDRVVSRFRERGTVDTLDGVLISSPEGVEPFWWLSVRPSNTEPLLRLNVEGEDAATMATIRDEALELIRR